MDPTVIELEQLPEKHFGAILADPPWRFKTYDKRKYVEKRMRSNLKGAGSHHYATMTLDDICALPVARLAATDCSLFLWISWPQLPDALRVIEAWGFRYKTCAFAWLKARATQIELFDENVRDQMGLGYWTRANSEVCLLATRGRPKRLDKGVRQAIIEPRRQHSRKPDCVHERIERLVAGPRLELFARARRPGWTAWGNELDKFSDYNGALDFEKSIDECYRVVRERMAAGGPAWPRSENERCENVGQRVEPGSGAQTREP